MKVVELGGEYPGAVFARHSSRWSGAVCCCDDRVQNVANIAARPRRGAWKKKWRCAAAPGRGRMSTVVQMLIEELAAGGHGHGGRCLFALFRDQGARPPDPDGLTAPKPYQDERPPPTKQNQKKHAVLLSDSGWRR